METITHYRNALVSLIATVVIYVALHLVGGELFDNNWSFIHWQFQPLWYTLIWLVALLALGWVLVNYGERLGRLSERPAAVLGAAVVLMLLLVLFQFDSFLYGGGNMRVAQIAQAPRVILRWFEFGAVGVVASFSGLFGLFTDNALRAAALGWKVLSLTCTLASLIGSVVLSRDLADEGRRRLMLFIIVFFGPQTLLYFGFVGVEPVIPAVTIWFGVMVVRLFRNKSGSYLLGLWTILMAGMFLRISVVFLLPAAVCATFGYLARKKGSTLGPGLWAGLLTALVLLAGLYFFAAQKLEWARYLLFVDGKPPFGDYGLLSSRHLGDYLQLLFLGAPLLILAKVLWMQRCGKSVKDPLLTTAFFMAIGGNITVLLIDPVNSIVLDTPRIIAFLAPTSIVLAMLLREVSPEGRSGRYLLGLAAAVSIMIPLSYLPTYTRIGNAEGYVTEYLEKNSLYYMDACNALRDAYYYNGDLNRANYWDTRSAIKSPDFLSYRGVGDLVHAGRTGDAIQVLMGMRTQHPYWIDIRTYLAGLQLEQRRFDLAKADIDTALMLDPYDKEAHIGLYSYYRETGKFLEAIRSAEQALDIYPGDTAILKGLMIIHHRAGDYRAADSLADELIRDDSTLAYPHLIKAFYADARKGSPAAINYYETFIRFAPDAPETPAIRKRLNDLVLQQREN